MSVSGVSVTTAKFPPLSLTFCLPKKEAEKEYFVQIHSVDGNTITTTFKTEIHSVSGEFIIINAPVELEQLNRQILEGVISNQRRWFSTPIQESVIRRIYNNTLTGQIGLDYKPEIPTSPGDLLIWSVVLEGIHIISSSISVRWNVEIHNIEQTKIQMDFDDFGTGVGSVDMSTTSSVSSPLMNHGHNSGGSAIASSRPVVVDTRKQSMATLIATAKLLEQYRRNLELFKIAEKNLDQSRKKLQELYGPDFEDELGKEFAVMNNVGNVDQYLQSQLGFAGNSVGSIVGNYRH